MGLFAGIRYGTERYPEKIARRLRAVNITAWISAAILAGLAVMRFLDDTPGIWKLGIYNSAIALLWAATPLLHRVGPLAAPIAFTALVYWHVFFLTLLLGTGSGIYMYYLTATALFILFVGNEHAVLAAMFGAAGAVLIIALHIVVPHDTGFMPEQTLFLTGFIVSVVASLTIIFAIVLYAVQQIARAEAAAEREHERSEKLLANILPQSVAARLKERSGAVIADRYANASILFADMAGFTARASDTEPEALVGFLDEVFARLDDLVERRGLEKIKTTGDAYMVVAGVPMPRADHAEAMADLAIDMRDSLAGLVDPKGRSVRVRIGMASGAVVAGVVGRRKFFYDVWGDAVNTASRMESTCEEGRIQVAPEMHALLKDRFELDSRGAIDVRGKGRMTTWYLIGRSDGSNG